GLVGLCALRCLALAPASSAACLYNTATRRVEVSWPPTASKTDSLLACVIARSFAGGVFVDGAADLLVAGQARGRAVGFRCDRGRPLRLCGAGGSGLCPSGLGGVAGAVGQSAQDRLLDHTDLSPAFGHLVDEFGPEGPLDHPLQVRFGLDHGADDAVGPRQ